MPAEKIKKYLIYIRNILFPKKCVSCNQADLWICQKCLDKVPIRQLPEFEKIRYQDYIDKIYITSYYNDNNIKKIIDLFKFKWQENLEKPLTYLILKFISKNKLSTLISNSILIPIPLHKRRYLERGFNQSELLAGGLSKKYNTPICTDLIRKKYTKHQTLLNLDKRQKNIVDAFVLKNNKSILGRNILLVDDVITTGASLNEAARILRQAGAKKVNALVLAKN